MDRRYAQRLQGPDVAFLVGGYDDGAVYGKVFEIGVPSRPDPIEWHVGAFGIVWGGQRQFTDRLINGFDEEMLGALQKQFSLSDDKKKELAEQLRAQLGLSIPYQFLPLQDCVDLAIFLLRTTMTLQTWLVDVRGVGGAIDVATITRTEGFKPIQQKTILGERVRWPEASR